MLYLIIRPYDSCSSLLSTLTEHVENSEPAHGILSVRRMATEPSRCRCISSFSTPTTARLFQPSAPALSTVLCCRNPQETTERFDTLPTTHGSFKFCRSSVYASLTVHISFRGRKLTRNWYFRRSLVFSPASRPVRRP